MKMLEQKCKDAPKNILCDFVNVLANCCADTAHGAVVRSSIALEAARGHATE